VESVNQVMSRVTELIIDLERRFADTSLLLVSHGDALQILQTAFAGRDASTHRQLQHLQTAEIRCFRLA
jgi:broad specificity phosphatase PhoE